MSTPQCDGDCEKRDGHVGTVRTVQVSGPRRDWGEFDYCEAARSYDRSRWFVVEEVNPAGEAGTKE